MSKDETLQREVGCRIGDKTTSSNLEARFDMHPFSRHPNDSSADT